MKAVSYHPSLCGSKLTPLTFRSKLPAKWHPDRCVRCGSQWWSSIPTCHGWGTMDFESLMVAIMSSCLYFACWGTVLHSFTMFFPSFTNHVPYQSPDLTSIVSTIDQTPVAMLHKPTSLFTHQLSTGARSRFSFDFPKSPLRPRSAMSSRRNRFSHCNECCTLVLYLQNWTTMSESLMNRDHLQLKNCNFFRVWRPRGFISWLFWVEEQNIMFLVTWDILVSPSLVSTALPPADSQTAMRYVTRVLIVSFLRATSVLAAAAGHVLQAVGMCWLQILMNDFNVFFHIESIWVAQPFRKSFNYIILFF